MMRRYINQVAIAFFALGLSVAPACSKKYDDAPLRQRIDKVETVVGSAEARVATLGKDLEALRQIVNAIKERDEITAVKEQKDEAGQISAYVLSFAKGRDITIKMATPGSDAVPPKISVAKHSDGHFYWQLDGQILRDGSGQMYRADGEVGKTPRLKIENDDWYASYNDGQSWVLLGRAKGAKGASVASESLFESIDYSSNPSFVTIKFVGGLTDLVVPRREELRIDFSIPDGTVFTTSRGNHYVIPFTIIGNVEGLHLYATPYLVEYTEGERSGKVHIYTDHSIYGELSSVSLVAVRGIKRYFFTFTLEYGIVRLTSKNLDFQTVTVTGLKQSQFEVSLRTNVNYRVDIPEVDRDWLSVADTRAAMRTETLRFTAKANLLQAPRRSLVRLVDGQGQELERIEVKQTAGEDKESAIEVTLGAGRSFWEIYQDILRNSWSTTGGYYQINGVVHRLKLKGTPTAGDWVSMSSSFSLCRILDLSEANIRVIPEHFFSVGILSASKVEYIIFPQGLREIESNAFANNDELLEADIPSGVMIAPDAFSNTPLLKKIRR